MYFQNLGEYISEDLSRFFQMKIKHYEIFVIIDRKYITIYIYRTTNTKICFYFIGFLLEYT